MKKIAFPFARGVPASLPRLASAALPFAFSSVIFSGVPAEVFAAGTAEKPNIVVFLVDDMGWQDTSVPFFGETQSPLNRRYRTPNMERLAARGVKFTNAYACPVSSPSRISLITGTNAARHRVTNWTLRKDTPTDSRSANLKFEEWNWNGMIPAPQKMKNAFTAKALPQILRENGYRTIHVGKAHFGATGTPAAEPKNIGFDVNIAGTAQGGPGSYYARDNYSSGFWTIPDLDEYAAQGLFLTDALTRAGVKEIERTAKSAKPFFLYFSQYAVHLPYQKDPVYEKNYPRLRGQALNYATQIEGMDKSLGDILDALEKTGVAENTVVIFMSDNGGHTSNGNAPARGGKGSVFEGGIREPLIAYWRGVTAAGTHNASPVIIEDFFPTILEIAGVKSCETPQKIDGVSFVPALKGAKINAGRALVFHYPNSWGERSGRGGSPASAIIVGKWKFVRFYEDGATMLFDLSRDIGEQRDLSAKNPAQAKKLEKMLDEILRSRAATMPFPAGKN